MNIGGLFYRLWCFDSGNTIPNKKKKEQNVLGI